MAETSKSSITNDVKVIVVQRFFSEALSDMNISRVETVMSEEERRILFNSARVRIGVEGSRGGVERTDGSTGSTPRDWATGPSHSISS